MARTELIPRELLVKHVLSAEAVIISKEIKSTRSIIFDIRHRTIHAKNPSKIDEYEARLDDLLKTRQEMRERGEWTVIR